MNEKYYVGQKAQSIDILTKNQPITQVIMYIDDNTAPIVAGTNTGATLEIDCPSATQAMADAILADVQGYAHQGYDVKLAFIDPLAELGDGITVGGFYSILAEQTITLGQGDASDIGAPGEGELESEYPYISKAEKAARGVMKLRSDLETAGRTIINGDNITTGTISADVISNNISQVNNYLTVGQPTIDSENKISFGLGHNYMQSEPVTGGQGRFIISSDAEILAEAAIEGGTTYATLRLIEGGDFSLYGSDSGEVNGGDLLSLRAVDDINIFAGASVTTPNPTGNLAINTINAKLNSSMADITTNHFYLSFPNGAFYNFEDEEILFIDSGGVTHVVWRA